MGGAYSARKPEVRRFVRRQDGTAAVEFAMCLPLLLVLLFFGIEIGRLLTDFQVVNKSLRDAARYLSQVGVTCTAPGNVTLASILNNGADATVATNLALRGSPDATAPLLLSYWNAAPTMTADCVSNTSYEGIYDDLALIPKITVQAAVPFSFLWGTTFASTASITINLGHSQAHIGK